MTGGSESIEGRLTRLLRDYLETDEVLTDEAGLVPIRYGSAVVFVGLVEGDPPLVHLRSPVLRQVPCSAALLAALNEINSQLGFGRMFWEGDAVFATENLVAHTIDLPELRAACDTLVVFADRHDDLLAARFGGSLAFE